MTLLRRILRIPTFATLCAALLLSPSLALALAAPGPLQRLGEEDLEALETLATYPEPLREAALRASLHADLLVEMQRIQDRSSDAFHQRISALDPDLQEQMWELVRVPGLLTSLGDGPPPSDAKLNQIAKRHPEAEAAIWSFGRLHHGLLVDLLKIHRGARDRFESLTSELSEADRNAFEDLVEEPELVSLLTQRVRLAVHLGESFRKQPKATRAHLSALSKEVAARNSAAEADWEQGLRDDPEAAAELEAARLAYAEDCDCGVGTYSTQVIHEVRVVHAYPYWFGYPSHYVYHPLHPYGYWRPHHYYRGHPHGYGVSISFALPAVGFLHWFFDGGHYDHYGHLGHHMKRHHRSHARARSGSHGLVGRWARGFERASHRPRGRHHNYSHGRSDRGFDRPFFSHRRNQNWDRDRSPRRARVEHSRRDRHRDGRGHNGNRVEAPRRRSGGGDLVDRFSRAFESRIEPPRRRGGDGERTERRRGRDRDRGEARDDGPRRRQGGGEARDDQPRRRRGGDEARNEAPRRRRGGDEARNDEPRRRQGGGEARGDRRQRSRDESREDRRRGNSDVSAPPPSGSRRDRGVRSGGNGDHVKRQRADRRGGDRRWSRSGGGSDGPRMNRGHDSRRAARPHRGGGSRRGDREHRRGR